MTAEGYARILLDKKDTQIEELEEKLKQGKEIIREFMRITEMVEGFEPDYSELIAKTEAFLKKDDNCPDVLCEDCTKTDCNIRKLGLVPDKKE